MQMEGEDCVFYELDPVRGRGARLGKIKQRPSGQSVDWSLSPDGSRIAAATDDGQIEILSVRDRIWSAISLDAKWRHLQSVAWAPDQKSLFLTCWFPDSFDLINATTKGVVSRLVHNGRSQWLHNPLPSPDGKYLAFEAQTWDTNLWMMENF
jgi:Tol biopolymer transport system component